MSFEGRITLLALGRMYEDGPAASKMYEDGPAVAEMTATMVRDVLPFLLGAVDIDAGSTLTADGLLTLLGAAAIDAGATITADGVVIHKGAATIDAGATVTADGEIVWDGTLENLTPALVAQIIGEAEPTHMHWGGEAAGATDLAGSSDLTDLNTPTKEKANALLGKVTACTVTQKMRAASTSDCDVGEETITSMWIGQVNGPFGFRSIAGKHNSAIGWLYFAANTGGIFNIVDTATGSAAPFIAANHGTTNGLVMVATREFGTKTAIYSREGSAVGVDVPGTMSGFGLLNIGSVTSFNALNSDHGMLLQWIGADGNFSDFDAARVAMAEALGLE